MHVIATAGHVDHGKSTLVEAITGTHPDRLAEERRRGLTIELGYCWTSLPGVGVTAFVDVPGHERFVATMLSGVGPVPAALLVVAADDAWMPQAAEHLAALDAFGVEHGVVAVTRSDLADPRPACDLAARHLTGTSLEGAPVVPVSAVTGTGLGELRAALAAMVRSLPDQDPSRDVRLWVDRCFEVRGSGVVVTGTLASGRIAAGDRLAVGAQAVRVRGLQSLGEPVDQVRGVARVALNLAHARSADVHRHSVLVTPDAWQHTSVVDVRLSGTTDADPPRRPLLHIGSVSVPVHLRPLGHDLARLTLDRELPLRIGDRALLRDPGSRRVWGVRVADPAPPELRRRGAARDRARALADHPPGQVGDEVERRGLVLVDVLRRIGVPVPDDVRRRAPDGWLVSDAEAGRLHDEMLALVTSHDAAEPLDVGLPVASVAKRLGVPSPELLRSLVRPPLRLSGGRITATEARDPADVPDRIARSVETLRAELGAEPFAAPTTDRMREVGLDLKGVTFAARAGLLLHLGDGVVLAPGADETAAGRLAELPQPFTTSEARQALGSTRRVVLPLLQHLDRRGLTRRLPDDRREIVR